MNDTPDNVVDLADLEGDFQSAKSAWKPEDKPFDDTPVPPGRYQVRIERAEVTTSQNGNPMLKWQLEVVSGKHAKRRLFRQNMLMSPENFRWLLQDLHTCRVHLDRLADLNDRVEDLLDVLVEVTVKNSTDAEGRVNQRVYINKHLGKWEPDDSPQPSVSDHDDDIPF